MLSDSWKFIFISAVGTSHLATATPCQDSSSCEIVKGAKASNVLIAVVADGAGSAKRADAGAMLACSYFVQRIGQHVETQAPLHEITRDLAKNWIIDYQREVLNQCDGDLVPRDFASTVLGAVIGDDLSVFFQLGDGAIVIADSEEPENYRWVFWPQQGQYANQTNFTTDEKAPANMEFTRVNRRIDEVTLFTDGVQSLTLDYQARVAHAPFFAPIFEWLRNAPEQHSPEYTASLNAFLNSERVNDRTDDDKTILLATRRSVATNTQSVQPDHDHPEIASL
jgi:hypothetical protein